jgi:hypothetical protein
MKLHILGIRHHGCGSARSVKNALDELKPDIVLIEGAPEANEILSLANHEEMLPPVAILIYAPENPQMAVFYPFAEFSPEWQAIQYALANKIPVRFIDLPQSAQLPVAGGTERWSAKTGIEEDQSQIQNPKSKIKDDPLQFAAEAAGFSDGEIWWENLVENRANPAGIFEGILDLMTALREESKKTGETEDLRTLRREAFMRQEIRRAGNEGFENAAVVCGAWHAPALSDLSDEKADRELLKNLPKTALEATWIPYTDSRLAFASGYGAGVRSPEFYRQIWENPQNITTYWLSRVAQLLREQDLDASSASVIEAVRLAESLAAVRGLAGVGLSELFDAVHAVFCFGDDAQLRLVEEKLIVGERMGEVPQKTPTVPLQRDLKAIQKRLRFFPEAIQKPAELDLRKANDLEKSHLLHRLQILGIEWGVPVRAYGKGTFKENWRVRWQPEFEIKIIEASLFGNSVEEAAANFVREKAANEEGLGELTALVQNVLLADLPAAIEILMKRVQTVASITSDVPQMMDAFVPLADVLRYGNVRKTETSAVEKITDGLLTRICIGLPNACSALNDEAAEKMFGRLAAMNNTIGVLLNEEYSRQWQNALRKLAGQPDLHGLIVGRSVRILFESNKLAAEEIEKGMNLAVTTAVAPDKAVAWIEGFLRGSGLVLLYHETLLNVLNHWVLSLSDEVFIKLLPILRRTFSSFEAPERRKIGEKIKGENNSTERKVEETEIDATRADKVLPLLEKILGL